MNVCPFRMQAGMIIEAQKTRLAVAGRSESSPIQMDLSCVGVSCMAFVKTGLADDGTPTGACGIGAAPIFVAQLGLKIDALNSKLDAVALGVVEATELAEKDVAEYMARVEPTATGKPTGVLHHFANKIRTLFETPPETEKKKGNLSAVPKET